MDQVDVPPRYYAGPVVLAAVTRRFYLYHQVLPYLSTNLYGWIRRRGAPPSLTATVLRQMN